MTETKNDKIITFMDSIGRTIFAEIDTEHSNEETLWVYNPVVVHTQPNPQTGQMALQLFPVFFREFLADKDQKIVWKYNRKNIVETGEEVVFDFKLKAQYASIFSMAGKNLQDSVTKSDNTIKLFNDEDDK
jgi:hypothetical protein